MSNCNLKYCHLIHTIFLLINATGALQFTNSVNGIHEMNSKFNNVNFKLNPIALRKAKIVYNFGLSECIRVKEFASSRVNAFPNIKTPFRRIVLSRKAN